MQLADSICGTTILFLQTIEEKGPQVVIIVTEIGIEIETIDAAMALSIRIDLVTDDGVLHQPSHADARAGNQKLPATMRRLKYRASRLKCPKRGHIWGWGQFKNHSPPEGQNGWNRGGSLKCAVPYLVWQTQPVVGPNIWG